MRLPKAVLTVTAAVAACAVLPSAAFAFGTVSGKLDQRSEHERVTRLALQCGGNVQPPLCFQPTSLNNVAGKGGTWGAVGAADNAVLHKLGDQPFWHCDDADYVQPADNGGRAYPASRSTGMDALRACVSWGQSMLYNGPTAEQLIPDISAVPDWGAVDTAKGLLNAKGNTVGSDPDSCTYNGVRLFGRAKCIVLEPWGYVLHMAEDFYSHTNWTDKADPTQPLSAVNPPGLGQDAVAPFLDLRLRGLPADEAIPAQFTGGCYRLVDPFGACTGHVIHGGTNSGINKDKALIDTTTGKVTDPLTPRGKITVDGVTNAQRAVDDAVEEARRQWDVFRSALEQQYGPAKGAKMACALSMDKSSICDTRNIVALIDTSRQRTAHKPLQAAPVAVAAQADDGATPAMAAGRKLVSDLGTKDRVSVLTFDSGTGDEDVDPFTTPDRTPRITSARDGDRAADPKVDGKRGGDEGDDDPTVVEKPDPAGTTPTPDDEVDPNGDHETPPMGLRAPVATAAAADDANRNPADALGTAGNLLAADDAPSGQQGVVMITNRIGDAGALARQIRALGERGAVVSLALSGGGAIPEPVVVAIESTGGVVLSAADAAALRGFVGVAERSGLTRLLDVFGPDQEATLADGDPAVLGVTDRGVDEHDVTALGHDATLTVRALEQPLTVVVTEARSGTVRRDEARAGDPATVVLDAAGDYEVHIEGPSGRRYTAQID